MRQNGCHGDAQERTVVTLDGEPAGPDRGPGRDGAGRRRRRNPRSTGDRDGRAAREGHAHRQHDQATAGGSARGSSRRGEPEPSQGHPLQLRQGAGGRPRPGAGRGTGAALAALHRRGHPERRRAAHRPGAAGGLAGGPLPRHPDHPLRPADGGPRPAGADAPRPAARRRPRGGRRRLPGHAAAPEARTCRPAHPRQHSERAGRRVGAPGPSACSGRVSSGCRWRRRAGWRACRPGRPRCRPSATAA